MSSLRRFLHEPLFHFALIGAGLFALYALIPGEPDTPGEIIVSRGKIEQLATGFAKIWQRPPTERELKGLIDDWVREELAVREATAMGLDRDDTVVRRRLRQKLEFLSDDAAAQVAPDADVLKAYLAANPGKFQSDSRYTFRQIYLNPERHPDDLPKKVDALKEVLKQSESASDFDRLGDPSLLEPRFEGISVRDLSNQFGPDFAAVLTKVTPGQWEGPLRSSFGLHFVRVENRSEGRLPELAEVEDAVRREWENSRRIEALNAFYAELLQRYPVKIESAPAEVAEPEGSR